MRNHMPRSARGSRWISSPQTCPTRCRRSSIGWPRRVRHPLVRPSSGIWQCTKMVAWMSMSVCLSQRPSPVMRGSSRRSCRPGVRGHAVYRAIRWDLGRDTRVPRLGHRAWVHVGVSGRRSAAGCPRRVVHHRPGDRGRDRTCPVFDGTGGAGGLMPDCGADAACGGRRAAGGRWADAACCVPTVIGGVR